MQKNSSKKPGKGYDGGKQEGSHPQGSTEPDSPTSISITQKNNDTNRRNDQSGQVQQLDDNRYPRGPNRPAMPGVPTHLHSNLPGNGQRSGEKSKDGGRNNANVPKGLRKRTPKEANHKTGGGVQRQLRYPQNTNDRPAGTQTPSMHTTS